MSREPLPVLVETLAGSDARFARGETSRAMEHDLAEAPIDRPLHVSPSEGIRPMTRRQARFLTERAEEWMARKSHLLTQAQALWDMGLKESARPVWATAASYEERIEPILDAIGREAEAALHRISAASCFEKSGDSSRAANLYRAALAAPIPDHVRSDVERMLSGCLKPLHRAVVDTIA